MFFNKKKRIKALEHEVKILTEEVAHLNDAERRSMIEFATVGTWNRRLERCMASLLDEFRELREKVAELSRKNISDTTLEEDEAPTPAQVLDEYLNGVGE